MKNLNFYFLLVGSFLIFENFSLPKETFNLEVTINGASNNTGKMYIALFNNSNGFLKSPYQTKVVEVSNKQALAVFKELPVGIYAVSCFQDKNSNQNLDTNVLGIPKEKFGFSNNPSIMLGSPKFKNTSFHLKENKTINIQLISL